MGEGVTKAQEAKEQREMDQRNEKRAKELGFSCAEEMRGELRRSGLIK
jgi:hypothetical protein